jgi:hypothetical protein
MIWTSRSERIRSAIRIAFSVSGSSGSASTACVMFATTSQNLGVCDDFSASDSLCRRSAWRLRRDSIFSPGEPGANQAPRSEPRAARTTTASPHSRSSASETRRPLEALKTSIRPLRPRTPSSLDQRAWLGRRRSRRRTDRPGLDRAREPPVIPHLCENPPASSPPSLGPYLSDRSFAGLRRGDDRRHHRRIRVAPNPDARPVYIKFDRRR